MAKHDGNMESSRELAMIDKEKVRLKYSPPPINELKHLIIDKRFHCRYYFKTKKKYNIKLRQLKMLSDFKDRFILSDSK